MKEGIILRDKCPCCNSISSKSIFKRSFDEELIKKYMNEAYQGNADIGFLENVLFEIAKCNDCNLSFQKYVLDEQRLNELYDKWIDPNLAKYWHKNSNTHKKSVFNSYILNYVKNIQKREARNIKILDYGAGFGEFLLSAINMGFIYSYAYEYSTERIKILEEKGIKCIDYNNSTLFDFIIINQVLEHLTYPTEAMKNIISRLNKNGIVYIAVPNCSYIEKKLENTENITDAKELHQVLLGASVGAFQHINFFNNYNLKLLCRNLGLIPINPVKYTMFNPMNIRSFIRPFYKYYFGTSMFFKIAPHSAVAYRQKLEN